MKTPSKIRNLPPPDQPREKLTKKRRAMTTQAASKVKRGGHAAEDEFANLIGGKVITGLEKGDVQDKAGNLHSVKGAEKKWQIFLYGKNRFISDHNISRSELFIKCIDSFPKEWEEYKRNKQKYKYILQPAMRALKDFLAKQNNKLLFLRKAFLNNKVNYFTIRADGFFHIFDGFEAIEAINKSTIAVNSKARAKEQMDDLKVVFKVGRKRKTTIGEIELRTDRKEKFRLIKFWMFREKTFSLLKQKIKPYKRYNRVIVYGKAMNSFRLI